MKRMTVGTHPWSRLLCILTLFLASAEVVWAKQISYMLPKHWHPKRDAVRVSPSLKFYSSRELTGSPIAELNRLGFFENGREICRWAFTPATIPVQTKQRLVNCPKGIPIEVVEIPPSPEDIRESQEQEVVATPRRIPVLYVDRASFGPNYHLQIVETRLHGKTVWVPDAGDRYFLSKKTELDRVRSLKLDESFEKFLKNFGKCLESRDIRCLVDLTDSELHVRFTSETVDTCIDSPRQADVTDGVCSSYITACRPLAGKEVLKPQDYFTCAFAAEAVRVSTIGIKDRIEEQIELLSVLKEPIEYPKFVVRMGGEFGDEYEKFDSTIADRFVYMFDPTGKTLYSVLVIKRNGKWLFKGIEWLVD